MQSIIKLPTNLQREIINFLKSLPTLYDGESQRAFLCQIGLEQQLQEQLSIGKPVGEFVPLLVSTLLKYGTHHDGQHVLEATLETAKNYVGQDRREECEQLLHALRVILAETHNEGRELQQGICFVLMPFKDRFNEYYQKIINPAIAEVGLEPLRADEIYSVHYVMTDIWKYINSAKILIAELTTQNPNVLYELGLAHAIGKPVILISQTLDDVPFDLRVLRVILYNTTDPDWAIDLKKNIVNTLQELLTCTSIEDDTFPIKAFNVSTLKRNILNSLSNLLTEEEFESDSAYYWKGYFLMDFEEYEKAISCFKKMIDKDPNNDEPFYEIACCYAKLGQRSEMLEYLGKAIEMDHENSNEALHDQDFEKYKSDKDFRKLVFFLITAIIKLNLAHK